MTNYAMKEGRVKIGLSIPMKKRLGKKNSPRQLIQPSFFFSLLTTRVEPLLDHRVHLHKDVGTVNDEELSKTLGVCLLIHVGQRSQHVQTIHMKF